MCHRPVTPRGRTGIEALFGDIDRYILSNGELSTRWQTEKLETFKIPFSIPLSWSPQIRVSRITTHKLIKQATLDVLETLQRNGMSHLLRNYGGSFAYRATRGASNLSTHAWGIALDFNTDTNALGTRGDMPKEVVAVFETAGFQWGGRWSRPDPMHFQYAYDY